MQVFFDFIQYALGNKMAFSHSLSNSEWEALFYNIQKQTLVGVLYQGVEKLPSDKRPPRELILKWYLQKEGIKRQNEFLNTKTRELCIRLANEANFRSVILKGQGIATYYPQPELRMCGDIDVWVSGTRGEVMDYVNRNGWKEPIVYHNISVPILEGVPVEIHFTPSWMFSYFKNCRLQHFFSREKEKQFSHRVLLADGMTEVSIPTTAFNRVYILLHIYRHLFGEGIGLRQLLDYYYILNKGFTEEERNETLRNLRYLGLEKFAAATMYVLQTVFGMSDKYLLLPPDEKRGRFLLNEIIEAGNFGKYDKRIKRGKTSPFALFCRRTARNFRFIRNYPSEVLWTPVFKIWHYFWRLRYNTIIQG